MRSLASDHDISDTAGDRLRIPCESGVPRTIWRAIPPRAGARIDTARLNLTFKKSHTQIIHAPCEPGCRAEWSGIDQRNDRVRVKSFTKTIDAPYRFLAFYRFLHATQGGGPVRQTTPTRTTPKSAVRHLSGVLRPRCALLNFAEISTMTI